MAKVGKQPIWGRRVLAQAMEMTTHPFEERGAEGVLDEGVFEETRRRDGFADWGQTT